MGNQEGHHGTRTRANLGSALDLSRFQRADHAILSSCTPWGFLEKEEGTLILYEPEGDVPIIRSGGNTASHIERYVTEKCEAMCASFTPEREAPLIDVVVLGRKSKKARSKKARVCLWAVMRVWAHALPLPFHYCSRPHVYFSREIVAIAIKLSKNPTPIASPKEKKVIQHQQSLFSTHSSIPHFQKSSISLVRIHVRPEVRARHHANSSVPPPLKAAAYPGA